MVFIKGFRFDKHKIATRYRDKVDGPDDIRVQTIIRQVMCDIHETSEYDLDFRVGTIIDGSTIFIVYDQDDNQAALEARELGPVEEFIWAAERDFITGPFVWEIADLW
ncbi:uncharacterized protein LACBIDRAFT_302897 [Laccaria bicolor S238N-H82]|uniref:Predicted protein n=1 Tax=Laccaria bicolor (strain S238N-H82 / ATCC MYA-4686) TaxID=486041 RepID=B0DIK2_LACBS|nr:uncharacterized protein LACBIDRAFT_302897 [Laccaria bicolor S238N-H82]EDR05703.1 predicted protein [Laccaria bicolor S238N-H82]|eukprot:XP_001883807.1 predicted protein [Laccaria bicolor S238N-H82]